MLTPEQQQYIIDSHKTMTPTEMRKALHTNYHAVIKFMVSNKLPLYGTGKRGGARSYNNIDKPESINGIFSVDAKKNWAL